MQILKSDKINLNSCVVALGNFDGVHLGHRQLFRHLVAASSRFGCPAVVLTFTPHPLKFLAPDNAPLLLNTPAEKRRLIAASHVDYLIEYPFTADLAAMSPMEFVADILLAKLKIKALIVGYDYAFGKNRCGDTQFLKTSGGQHGFDVDVLQPVGDDGVPYSSTMVREMLMAGNVSDAVVLLGRQYNIEGVVVHGDKRGTKLGFPTANLQTDKELLPLAGVYAVKVRHGEEEYSGVVNLGVRPTFNGVRSSVEVYLLDYSGQLYGESLRIYFVERLRGERKFSSVSELVEAITVDIDKARKILSSVQIVQYREYLALP